jgi:hypothetical protein
MDAVLIDDLPDGVANAVPRIVSRLIGRGYTEASFRGTLLIFMLSDDNTGYFWFAEHIKPAVLVEIDEGAAGEGVYNYLRDSHLGREFLVRLLNDVSVQLGRAQRLGYVPEEEVTGEAKRPELDSDDDGLPRLTVEEF